MLKEMIIDSNDILVSFNMVNLISSMSADVILNIVKEFLTFEYNEPVL